MAKINRLALANYSTLAYIDAIGYDITEIRKISQVRRIARKGLSEYELKYYHKKILGMPLATFSPQDTADMLTHNYVREVKEINSHNLEIVSDKEYTHRTREDNRRKISLVVLGAYALVLVWLISQMYDIYKGILY